MSYTLIDHIQSLLQRGLDLIFPPCCVGCSRSGKLLCSYCLQSMQPLITPVCQWCGLPLATSKARCVACEYRRPRLNGLRSVNIYSGALRRAIHALKYRNRQRLALPLGKLMAQAFQSYRLRADSIVPLPLHVERQRKRGYNQASLLARICGAYLKVPCLENIVIRQRDTPPQVGLQARERYANVSGAFALAPATQTTLLASSTILLIDDVSTTGATLEACAAPLYAAGVSEVWGLVLGRPSDLVQDTSKGML